MKVLASLGARPRGLALPFVFALLCLCPGSASAKRQILSVDTTVKSSISAFAGTMVFLDVDYQIVSPRVAIDVRYGLDLGFISFEFDTGVSGTRVHASQVDDTFNDDTLKRLHFGMGLRFQVPNDSVVLPYLSGMFDFNWWNLFQREISCGGWVCGGHSKYRYTPGFTGRAGVAFDVGSGLLIDVGLGAGMSFEGGFFPQNVYWLEPYIGITFRQ